MHAGFLQFAAFDQDSKDNRAFLARGRLQMPVLAVGGEHSFGATMAHVVRFCADDVQQAVVPNAGHWLMEEQPSQTIAVIRPFLAKTTGGEGAAFAPRALPASEVDALARGGAGAGTSGIVGIQTTVLAGDPTSAGPYAIELRVPPRTRIAAHSHRDNRYARVVSGEWHFGYGKQASEANSATLPAGSFYTEPAGIDHFAFTTESPAVVYITGYGPTDTQYVQAKDDPRAKK